MPSGLRKRDNFPSLNRRDFLRTGLAGGLGLALHRLALPACASGAEGAPRIKSHRVLGRTGLRVSDVGFGGYGLEDPVLVDYAIDLGVSFIDTAADYGRSEETIGRVMPRRRKEVVLATKWHPEHFHDKEWMLASLDRSLKRLRTDHVDVIHIHEVDDIRRVQNPQLFKAFRTAREQGKARFLGATGHGKNLMRVMDWVVDSGKFDTILVAYNFGTDRDWQSLFGNVGFFPEMPKLLARAKEKGVGVTCMKTLRGAKHNDLSEFKKQGESFPRAAMKWTLSNPNVSNLVITMKDREGIEEAVAASGEDITTRDREIIDRYARLTDRTYCRPACGACLAGCPGSLKINDILRFKMYYENYGAEQAARESYARLSGKRPPEVCAGCSSSACIPACPFGLPVKDLLSEAHRVLSS